MRRMLLATGMVIAVGLISGAARAEDPFAGGGDALAVKDSDSGSSLRAKLKLKKMLPDMVMLKVLAVNDAAFPRCVVTAQVLKGGSAKAKHFKLLARGKTYRFVPSFKGRGFKIDLANKMNQNNLGACYYGKNTKLVARIKSVDLKKKAFLFSELYQK